MCVFVRFFFLLENMDANRVMPMVGKCLAQQRVPSASATNEMPVSDSITHCSIWNAT